MSRHPEISPWSLAQYLTGRATPHERDAVDVRRAEDPEFWEKVSAVQDVFSRIRSPEPVSALDQQVAWDRLHLRLSPNSGTTITRHKHSRRYLYMASAMLMTCIAVFIGRFIEPPVSSVAHTYTTRAGQRITVDLSDGSQVILGPQSRLSLVEGAKQLPSTLQLLGEARFEVHANERRTFSVRTGSVITRVLGTVFTVRRYPTDSATTVGVLSGKVSVGTQRDNTTLSAGHIGYFSDSRVIATRHTSPHEFELWTDDRLNFVDAPVPVILRELSRWYGYTFRLDDTTLFRRHATVTFKINDRLETFRLLKELLEVTISIKDSTVILRPTGSTRDIDQSRDIPRFRKDPSTMIAPKNEVGR